MANDTQPGTSAGPALWRVVLATLLAVSLATVLVPAAPPPAYAANGTDSDTDDDEQTGPRTRSQTRGGGAAGTAATERGDLAGRKRKLERGRAPPLDGGAFEATDDSDEDDDDEDTEDDEDVAAASTTSAAAAAEAAADAANAAGSEIVGHRRESRRVRARKAADDEELEAQRELTRREVKFREDRDSIIKAGPRRGPAEQLFEVGTERSDGKVYRLIKTWTPDIHLPLGRGRFFSPAPMADNVELGRNEKHKLVGRILVVDAGGQTHELFKTPRPIKPKVVGDSDVSDHTEEQFADNARTALGRLKRINIERASYVLIDIKQYLSACTACMNNITGVSQSGKWDASAQNWASLVENALPDSLKGAVAGARVVMRFDSVRYYSGSKYLWGAVPRGSRASPTNARSMRGMVAPRLPAGRNRDVYIVSAEPEENRNGLTPRLAFSEGPQRVEIDRQVKADYATFMDSLATALRNEAGGTGGGSTGGAAGAAGADASTASTSRRARGNGPR